MIYTVYTITLNIVNIAIEILPVSKNVMLRQVQYIQVHESQPILAYLAFVCLEMSLSKLWFRYMLYTVNLENAVENMGEINIPQNDKQRFWIDM